MASSTVTRTATAAFVAVAQGPGTAYITFEDEKGFWALKDASDPTGITGSHPAHKGYCQAITLETGEYLHVRGRGNVTVTAATVI